ncbi:hypothetical protein KR222_010218 [Zaprionus bogoriensis]|nr:hypothetical protein KR222_010218 [Zaprionus bogoriensis]
MAKTNGWAVACGPSTSSGSAYSKYTRCTELRHVADQDIYKLASILDLNGCWRKLMASIPKHLDAQACSAPGALNLKEITDRVGLKYNAYQISLIDAERLSPGQCISEVMINEWKTSGKQNERPTVGVLLELLLQAEIYSAADHVAVDFLGEPRPSRPNAGPARPIFLDFSTQDLAEDMEVDEAAGFQPNNQVAAQGRGTGLNLDVFEKQSQDKSVPQQPENGAVRPVRPPRAKRENASSALTTLNTPMLSILNASEKVQPAAGAAQPAANIPNLSILNGTAEVLATAATTTGTTVPKSTPKAVAAAAAAAAASTPAAAATITPNVPLITLLIENSAGEIADTSELPATAATMPDASAISSSSSLPAISALNLNTDNGAGNGLLPPHAANADNISRSEANSISNDDDDDDDDDEEDEVEDDDDDGVGVDVDDYDDADVSLHNLSNSEQRTSNNDSSLTTVTGTSGENSFEITNDSSSASIDDFNMPNLSELQK